MGNIIFWLLIAIVVLNFLFETILTYLNKFRLSDIMPDIVSDIYDEKLYQKQQHYTRENIKISFIESSFEVLLVLILLLSGLFPVIDTVVRSISSSVIPMTLLFFGLFFLASIIIKLPFQYYDTFVVEEKYGFNKSTKKLFFTDWIKQLLLSVILGGLILSLFTWFWIAAGQFFWIYAAGSISLIMIIFSLLYSRVIVPLFNKQSPLSEGELRNAIQDFAQKAGFKLKNIYVIDGSKRSTKANAYFTGFGPEKRIVLYDTLINDMNTNEIVAVLAHEIGHYKHKHVIYGIITSGFQIFITFFVLSLMVNLPVFAEALGVQPSFHISLLVFGILFSPLSSAVGIIMNVVSRKNEYTADAFAKKYDLSDSLIQALIKLSKNNLSNLTPHPVYVFVNYSHPTLLQRINALKK